jgi:ribosomal protein L22
MSEVRAKIRYAASSAQKMRRVMTAVRGRKAEEALTFLQAMI